MVRSEPQSSRVAAVTGAARGIGAAAVAELVERGYRVLALDSCAGQAGPPGVRYGLATRDDLEAVATTYPDRVMAMECDVRDCDQLSAAVGASLAKWGRLDAVVSAAGVVVGGESVWETPDIEFETVFDVNVRGLWNLAKATIPALLSGPRPSDARFVAVASAAGERGMFHLGGYTVSKHAVVGIVRALAADLVGTGVSAVAVSPGATNTRLLAATADLYGTSTAELAAHQGLRRAIQPAEVASVLALCCEPAGGILNGSVVSADGGFGL